MVVLGLIGGAVWIGLSVGRNRDDQGLSPACGLGLCADEAVIEPQILVEKCSPPHSCELVPYEGSVFLRLIDLDTSKKPRCGPGDCGAQTHALQSGWAPGRWQIVAPRIRKFPDLLPPEPVDISLQAGETLEIQLVYRDPLKGWPRGPFAHNCLPQNADAEGDFDGDGSRDRVDFSPVYDSEDLVGWTLRQRFGSGHVLNERIDAECPEVIGAVDIDGDGRDELFYDTGKGMTAALVDVLRFHKDKLDNIIEVPKDFSLYVGTSNAGGSSLECYRTRDRAGFVVTTFEDDETSVVYYTLRRRQLLQGIEDVPDAVVPPGELRCFNLSWMGY